MPSAHEPSEDPKLLDSGVPPGADAVAPVDQEAAADAAWLKGLQRPNIPVRFDARVMTYLKLYRDSPRGRAIARAWAKKSGRYTPTLKRKLAHAGLPTDLVWLSLIESGHNPTIQSPAGATGLWQFIAATGKTYGLTIDRWVDERLDPRRATEAAIRLLSDLQTRFGSWHLAMAAYNMGHGGMTRAIRKFNTNDFWELSRFEAGIPWETTLYVPKILAIAIVMNNKRAFGIHDVTPDPPERFDIVLVDPGVELAAVAKSAGISREEVIALNPHYLASRTPPAKAGRDQDRWPVNVPHGMGRTAARALSKRARPSAKLAAYVTRFGDTQEAVAGTSGATLGELRRINHLGSNESLAPGTVLLVPQGAAPSLAPADEDSNVVVVPQRELNYPDRDRVFYRVVAGDTLDEVARAFHVPSGDLVAWNMLDKTARLQSHMVLQVFVRRDTPLDRVRHRKATDARVLVVGSDEFFDYFEARNGRKRVVVTAAAGDTLGSIGQRYGMSIGSMERVNRRSRRDALHPGERLVVYTKAAGGAAARSADGGVEPLEATEPPRPDALPPYGEASSRADTPTKTSGG
jgi:membrane-bound lytic murein transglycosylase D